MRNAVAEIDSGAAYLDARATNRPRTLVVVSISDLLARDLPARAQILSPWLLTQSLNMIHAWRGVGKTHVALGIAYAVATGGEFLGWKAEIPRRVLYVDGEMPGSAIQDRLAQIVKNADKEDTSDFLHIVTPDLQPDFAQMPDLASAAGQDALDAAIPSETEVIILDNLSCLVRGSGRENEAESWLSAQGWALQKRAQGKTILFVHHSGKDLKQRGTSKREDVLDSVVGLRQPSDYEPSQGARFEIHFEKSRNAHGEQVAPMEAHLITDADGRSAWTLKSVADSTFNRVVELAKEGLRQAEIAVELNVNRSTVSRHFRKGLANGLIPKEVK